MNLEHVNYFITCAACLNFSLAAKHHFVSVSTLSRGISALEDELGVKLFERGYHGHSLTRAGEEFFKCCIKNSVEMNRYVMHWSKTSKDAFRIGCCPGNPVFEKLINACAKMPADYLPQNIKVVFIEEEDIPYAINTGFIDVVAFEMKPDFKIESVITAEFFRTGDSSYVFVAQSGIDNNLLLKLSNLKKFI